MRNKEFREVQVSSSGLVFIFIAILVLGVFIFLLGVSVGKKQVRMAGPTTILARPATETVSDVPPAAVKVQGATPAQAGGSEPKTPAKSQLPDAGAAVSAITEKPAPRTAVPGPAAAKVPVTKPAPQAAPGSFYIQVAAFNERSQADALVARFKGQGYPAVVMNPFPSDRRATYRVRLVGYRTKEQASQVLAKLNSATTKRTGYYIRKED